MALPRGSDGRVRVESRRPRSACPCPRSAALRGEGEVQGLCSGPLLRRPAPPAGRPHTRPVSNMTFFRPGSALLLPLALFALNGCATGPVPAAEFVQQAEQLHRGALASTVTRNTDLNDYF